jgi:hypothetical protein
MGMDHRMDGVGAGQETGGILDRKDFLKLAGAAGLGAALGSNILPRQALALGPTGPSDPSFSFAIKADYSAFDVISDNFVEHRDGFDKNQNLYRVLTPAPELKRGSVSLNKGRLQVSGDSPFFTLFRTTKSPSAPYAAVIVDVAAFSGSAVDQKSVYAGLIKDASNYVVAWYNHATQKAGFDVAVNGTITKLAETSATLAAPMRFAFVLNSKEITALADTGGGAFDGWKPVANYPNVPTTEYPDPATAPGLSQYVDLRDPNVLAQYKYGFGARGGSGATIVLDGVEAGYWGRAGVRDNHVVTYADGTPYIKDNKLYLTLTNAGLDFFSTAHWGVYTLDLSDYTSPTALKEVGKLFVERECKVMGDHAGHIVYDDAAGGFLIGVSTWGDFTYKGVQVNYTRASSEVLSGVHVLKAQELALPTALSPVPDTLGNWDPHFTRIGREWYVAFVESPIQGDPPGWDHHPALAKGPTIENLTLVDAKEELNQTEGMVIQKVGGKWYVLCSSGRGEITFEGVPPASYRVYDLKMKLVGTLNAPYVTNIPHPMITPLPDLPGPGDTKWIMLTFNETFFYIDPGPANVGLGYGTHGNFVVMDGPTWEDHYEFEPR